MTADEIVDGLRTATPVPGSKAKRELPGRDGFYAWWVKPGSLPGVPTQPHPDDPWELLYVGIAPGGAGSTATISSRVGGNHIGGNTGSSTFRFSLASLLFEREGWRPVRTTTKVVLSREDNASLSTWLADNAALTWVECREPWSGLIEAEVVELAAPPMNREHNQRHPFYPRMGDARRRFREAAT